MLMAMVERYPEVDQGLQWENHNKFTKTYSHRTYQEVSIMVFFSVIDFYNNANFVKYFYF